MKALRRKRGRRLGQKIEPLPTMPIAQAVMHLAQLFAEKGVTEAIGVTVAIMLPNQQPLAATTTPQGSPLLPTPMTQAKILGSAVALTAVHCEQVVNAEIARRQELEKPKSRIILPGLS